MEAKFGVNQEYDGIDELQPVDEEQEEAAAEDAVGISVSTLNENGTIENRTVSRMHLMLHGQMSLHQLRR